MGIESRASHQDDRIPQPDIEVKVEKAIERTPKVSNVKIVQLKPDDWEVLRDIKLKSLGQEPIAFEDQKEGMARYSARTEAEWRGKLDEEASSTVSVFARNGEDYVGTVNGIINIDEKKALIQHMYVDQGYRGRGIGRELLETLIQKLKDRGDIKKAELAVVKDQKPAIQLYKSLGFKEVREVQVKRGNQTYTELVMEREL